MTDESAPSRPAGGAQESRTRVQAVVEGSPSPVTVEEIADRTGLHANTIRGHLDVLLASGAIERVPAGPQGRGRPRWLYRSAMPKASPFHFLAEALTAQLARTQDPGLADAAAQRWAHALPALPAADSPDEAVAEATNALNRLGFIAELGPIGDSIAVSSCPYADLVDDNPVICDIHTALVVRLLEQTGQPVTLEAMDVFPRRGVCIARLRRPDLEPVRTIEVGPRRTIAATPSEGTAS